MNKSNFPPLPNPIDPKRVDDLADDLAARSEAGEYRPRVWEYLRDLLVLACLAGGAMLMYRYMR